MLLLTRSARGVNDVEGPGTASDGAAADTDADMLLMTVERGWMRLYGVCRGEFEEEKVSSGRKQI